MKLANQSPRAEILNVQNFVDERPMGFTQWLILSLCFLVLIADGFHTAVMAFVAPAVTVELSISKLALSPLLAAALIGLAAGALVAGPVADRIGRRRVLVASVAICSAGSLLTSGAVSILTLLIFRFVTGLGIGAAMPNCTTLASEFVPSKWRALLLNLMFCGFPLGASTSGFLAAWMVPRYGWRSVFVAGGTAPLVVAALLICLPESISFMVVRQAPLEKIRRALYKIAGQDKRGISRIAAATHFELIETVGTRDRSPWKILFAPRYLVGTFMLWITYFMGLVLYYLLTSWMPTLIRDAGYSISRAAITTALFPLGGGIGALCCGWLMGRMNPTRVVSGAYFLTAILLLVLAHATGAIGPLMGMTFLAGLAVNGAQTSLPVLAASSYPTSGRASGVAWMLGVGRIGGILGAFGGGFLAAAGFSLKEIISGLSLAAVIAALALLCKDSADSKLEAAHAIAKE